MQGKAAKVSKTLAPIKFYVPSIPHRTGIIRELHTYHLAGNCQEKIEKESGQKELEEQKEQKEEKETEPANQGKLLLDATVAPADIRYPTDIKLLNEAREQTEIVIDALYQQVKEQLPKKPRTYRREARTAYLQIATPVKVAFSEIGTNKSRVRL